MRVDILIYLAFLDIQDPIGTLKEASWRPIMMHWVHDLRQLTLVKIKLFFRANFWPLALKLWLVLRKVVLIKMLVLIDTWLVVDSIHHKFRNLNIVEIEILIRKSVNLISKFRRACRVTLDCRVRSV